MSETRERYWIKSGVEVYHRDHPHRKMYVDKVLKESKEIMEGTQKVRRSFVRGIECHWMSGDGNYGKGIFLTIELLPWKNHNDEIQRPIENLPILDNTDIN